MENMETIDSTSSGQSINEAHKEALRGASLYMKIHSIIMIVFLSIATLGLLVLVSVGPDQIMAEMQNQLNTQEERMVFEAMMPMMTGMGLFMLFIIGGYLYASTRLLSSANSLGAVSYTGSVNDLYNGFKAMKKFWIFSGIITILVVILVIVFVARLVPQLIEMQQG